jgi:hypothetical protein
MKVKMVNNGEEFEIPEILEKDMEAMFEAQVKLNTNDQIYAAYVGMRALVQSMLKRIDPNLKVEDLPMRDYMAIVEEIKVRNEDIFPKESPL